MDVNKEKISKVFMDGRVLYIPFYQRSYVWKSDLWERFRDDMEYISSHDEDYFFGSIILKDIGASGIATDRQVVVDGQQRITTMAIYIKVLSLLDPQIKLFDKKFRLDDGSLTILHSKSDREAFELIAAQNDTNTLDGDSNLLKAYNYFIGNIDIKKVNINNILARTIFITINLNNDENEHKIFDTINSLGVGLTTGELLKNHFFDESSEGKYQSIWEPVFEKDQDCLNYWSSDYTIGRQKTLIQEGFFYYLLQIMMHDPQYGLTSDDKKEFRKFDSLFENYKKLMVLGHRDKIEFATEIAEYAKIYKSTFNPNILKEAIARDDRLSQLLLSVFALEGGTVLPFVLYTLKNVNDDFEQNRIFEYLESYLVRRQICRCKNSNYSDLFAENLIGNQVQSFDALHDYISKKDSSLKMPEDKDVCDYVRSNNGLSAIKAKCILFLLEFNLRSEKQATTLKPFSDYSLEHLMPQKWTTYWMPENIPDESKQDFITERDSVINTLGNLAIITQQLNSSIRNATWNKKKNGNGKNAGLIEYASDLFTLKDVINKQEWNEDTIEERAEWIASKVNEIWKK